MKYSAAIILSIFFYSFLFGQENPEIEFRNTRVGQNKKSEKYSDKAHDQYQKGNLQGAIELYTKAIEADSTNMIAYQNRGLSYNELGDHEKGLTDLKKAQSIDPEYSDVYYNLGFVYETMNDNDAALKNYHIALEKDSFNIDAYLNISFILESRGELKASLKNLEEGISAAGYDGSLNYSIGRTYYLLEDYSSAVDFLFIADETLLGNYLPSLYLYRLFSHTNENKDACEYFKKAKELGAPEEKLMEGDFLKCK